MRTESWLSKYFYTPGAHGLNFLVQCHSGNLLELVNEKKLRLTLPSSPFFPVSFLSPLQQMREKDMSRNGKRRMIRTRNDQTDYDGHGERRDLCFSSACCELCDFKTIDNWPTSATYKKKKTPRYFPIRTLLPQFSALTIY